MLLCLAVALLQTQRVSDHVVPTGQNIRPAGKVTVVPSRPVDVVLSPDGSRLYVKDSRGLRVIDAKSMADLDGAASPGGTSLCGIGVSPDGKHVYLTNAGSKLHDYDVTGKLPKLLRSIDLPGKDGKGNSFPCGIKVSKNGKRAYVCLSLTNSLGIVDLEAGKLLQSIPVGVAPYGVVLSPNEDHAVVTNQGGLVGATGPNLAPSAGTPTQVDKRGVAKAGSVSFVNIESGQVDKMLTLGRQPSAILSLSDGTYVAAETNEDKLVWISAEGKLIRTLSVKPDSKLPFGSMPTALAQWKDRLFVALAGSNAVAVVKVGTKAAPKVEGFFPTGWFPTGVAVREDGIFVGSGKGLGSRLTTRKPAEGWNSYDYAGTIQKLPANLGDLKKLTQMVMADASIAQTNLAVTKPKMAAKVAVPVPVRLGDPSVFKHVVYVIKENRTFDQVFGDLKIGDGDPSLCIYGEEVTPNHHAIAREFATLDNYYCNGVLSADGHSWASEANVTPYLERAFGGFNRSYTFGDDPLTYSSTGFLWDQVLDAGLTFRNFGEMDYAEAPKGMGLRALLKARGGEYPAFTHNIGIARLKEHSDPLYPGWNMEIPDVVRMDRFLAQLSEYKKKGTFPNLTIVYLPQDHTGSSVTARANVADNDLAVGQLIEGISKSKFWPNTVVFVNEDDPQGGFDHIDGHRSICLVASPYTRGKGLVKDFSNQTSVIHTILQILGLPPMNQRDAAAPLMFGAFGKKADLRPYVARANRIPLDETMVPGQTKQFTAFAAPIKAKLVGMRESERTAQDDDALNRMIWHEAKGMNTPYPAAFAGAHGKGLAKRRLKLAPRKDVRDEDGR